MNASDEKLVGVCPMGHRIRGPLGMRGKWVACPKCQTGFEFAASSESRREQSPPHEPPVGTALPTVPVSMTDTGVMRIIGEWTPPANMTEKFAAEAQAAIQRARLGADNAAPEVERTPDDSDVRSTVAAIRAAFAITQPVGNVMRTICQAVCLNVTSSIADTNDEIKRSGHQWYPVFHGSREKLIGVVHVSDLDRSAADAMAFDLRSVMQLPIRVQESLTTDRVKDKFRNKQAFFAFIVNESGETIGFVTDRDCRSQANVSSISTPHTK